MSQQKPIRIEDKLPKRDKAVIVVCADSRCLGYLDSKGVWRVWQTHVEITGVVGWFHVGDDWW